MYFQVSTTLRGRRRRGAVVFCFSRNTVDVSEAVVPRATVHWGNVSAFTPCPGICAARSDGDVCKQIILRTVTGAAFPIALYKQNLQTFRYEIHQRYIRRY